jgi:hypothetical protein
VPSSPSAASGHGKADARQNTVSFGGFPATGDQPCGSDHTAEAIESELAIEVIVIERRNPTPAVCSVAGARRAALVDLASPLGDRAVLEVKEGLPVPVLEPR